MDWLNKHQKGGWLNRRIYNTVDATGQYSGGKEETKKQAKRFIKGTPTNPEIGDQELFGYSLGVIDKKDMKYWKPSEYKPSISKDPNVDYLAGAKIDTINVLGAIEHMERFRKKDTPSVQASLAYYKDMMDPLADHTVTRSSDEKGKFISIWDKWDFKSKLANKLLKRKPEVYDRFYYKDNPDFSHEGEAKRDSLAGAKNNLYRKKWKYEDNNIEIPGSLIKEINATDSTLIELDKATPIKERSKYMLF